MPMTDSDNRISTEDALRRIGDSELEIKYIRDEQSDMNRSLSSMEATLHIFSAQLETQGKRRDPWQNIITAAGVLLTIGVLALTPIAWLSVSNYNRYSEIQALLMERGQKLGEITATIDHVEGSVRDANVRYTDWLVRVEAQARARHAAEKRGKGE